MPHLREVKTCDRCRHFKRRCDLLKPSCTRCVQAGVRCSFDVSPAHQQQPLPSPSPSSSLHPHPLHLHHLALAPTTANAPMLAHHPGPFVRSLSSSSASSSASSSSPLSSSAAESPPPPPSYPAMPVPVPVHHLQHLQQHQQHQQHHLHHHHHQQCLPSAGPSAVTPISSAARSTPREDLSGTATPTNNSSHNGLISPTTTTTESPESSLRPPSSGGFGADAIDRPPPHGSPPVASAAASAASATAAAASSVSSTPTTAASASAPASSSTATANGAPFQERIVRKRKRNCLSCLRCHRLKVKCDKELPCGRCKASGQGRECYYSYNKGPNGGKFPCPTAPVPSSKDEKKPQMATWQVQHRVRGSSHWRELMAKIGSLAASSATAESSPLAAALEGVGTNACLANFCLPGNFPFGTPGATKYYARDAVTRLLAGERARADDYLERYLDLLDVVNPILDISTFREEIERYWQDPASVSLCWLSQLLMVMGLGCFTSADEPPVATELMMAAEACLMQTPFMFRPTLMTLRALSLMSVAKLVCNATCWSVDSCWTLLGLLVRVAFIFGLPQERNDNDEELRDPVEKEARRKLWLTVLYLDVKVSLCTGMPPLTRPDELGDLRSMPEWRAPDGLQMVLYQSLPTVLAVLAQINSKKDHMSYPDVLRYNAQLRELMGHAQRVCHASLQRITVDIFLRRCLMVLHRPFALHPEGPTLFPESYWSSLECSLALLVHYRELWCAADDGADAGLRLDLVGRAFVLDFFSATLTTCVHMLREDAPLSGAAATSCRIPPRQLILDTLRSCVDIWSGEQEKSVCWRTGYHLLRAVLALLPGAQQQQQPVLGVAQAST